MMCSSYALVWRGLAPARVEAFCWLAAARKIATVDNIRRGLVSEYILDLC